MIHTVTLKASSRFDLGLEHGMKLRDEIHAIIEDFVGIVRKSFWLFKIVPPGLVTVLLFPFLRPRFTNEAIEEMKGIAQGAGVPLRWIVFNNSFFDIGQVLLSLGLAHATWGCSGFLSQDTRGKFVIAKTFDISPARMLVKHRLFFNYQCAWLDHAYTIFGFPSLIAGDYFMNRNGLTGVFFQGGLTRSWESIRGNQMTVEFYRGLYESGTDLKSVLGYIKEVGRPIASFSGIITDGKKAYVIEKYARYCMYRQYTGEPLLKTNHFTDSKMIAHYVGNYRQNEYYRGSVDRLSYLQKTVGRTISLSQAKDVLAHVDPEGKGSIATSISIFALIKDYGSGTVLYTGGENLPATVGKRYDEMK